MENNKENVLLSEASDTSSIASDENNQNAVNTPYVVPTGLHSNVIENKPIRTSLNLVELLDSPRDNLIDLDTPKKLEHLLRQSVGSGFNDTFGLGRDDTFSIRKSPPKEGKVDLLLDTLVDVSAATISTSGEERLLGDDMEVDEELQMKERLEKLGTMEIPEKLTDDAVNIPVAEASEAEPNETFGEEETKLQSEKSPRRENLSTADLLTELEIKDNTIRLLEQKLVVASREPYEVMDLFEKLVTKQYEEFKEVVAENANMKIQLKNKDIAFGEVLQKFERAKNSVLGLKANQDTLLKELEEKAETARNYKERHDNLREHAITQIQNANRDIALTKNHYEMEIKKIKAFVRRLEIENLSVKEAFAQKVKECEALSMLCEEVTGKNVK